MRRASIVKDYHFRRVSQVTLDSKKRATLSKSGVEGKIYQVYQNDAGQIMLDPMSCPESCAWPAGESRAGVSAETPRSRPE